ncbi:MAG: tetratricopeptide repeat protein [Chlorobiaceae bacterium]|nr:tetratricopeptide repeat protein [Chlorobiaceae bacterium]
MLKDALGAYRGSEREMSRLIDADPDNAEAYCGRAGVRSAEGDLEGALMDYSMAIRLGLRYRESIGAYGNRGLIRFQTGDYEGAIDDFSGVINRHPMQKGLVKAALLQRALAKEKIGDREGASADRRLAKLLSPDREQQKHQGESII